MSRFRESNRRELFRTYISNSLYYQSEGKRLAKRYDEIINSRVDDRDVNDIVAEINAKAGLTMEVKKDEHI